MSKSGKIKFFHSYKFMINARLSAILNAPNLPQPNLAVKNFPQSEPQNFTTPHDNFYTNHWLNGLTTQNYSPATVQTYFFALKHFLQYLQQHPQFSQIDFKKFAQEQCDSKHWQTITRQHISEYLAYRIEVDRLAVTSVQHELTVLRQFFSWLIAQKVLDTNPTTAIRLKRPPRPLPKLIDGDVITRLLEQSAPEKPSEARLWVRDKAMLELLYGSGLRVSELIGLDLADIDSSQKLLRVKGKGNKTRIVPIGGQAWQALQNYLPHRHLWAEDESLAKDGKNSDNNWGNNAVFISERLGTRLTTRTVQLRIKVQARRAGIAEDLYPHLLRHCFASDILSSSGDLRGVQELLGHSDISTTQIYTHLDFKHLATVYDNAHPRAKK